MKAISDLFNEYGRKARLFPAVLCLPPFFLMTPAIFEEASKTVLTQSILGIAIGDVTLAVVLIYLLTQLNRIVSKVCFEDKNNFPTTQMLLPSSKELSLEYRARIQARVTTDFGLSLPDANDEAVSLSAAKTRVREIVSLVVHRVGSGQLLLQHNIEYGFARNLAGGALVAFIISCIDIVIFRWVVPNTSFFNISVGLGVLYLIVVVTARPVLRGYSRSYAELLFREYLGMA